MFIKTAFRAPFYFFAGEGEGAAGGAAGSTPAVTVTPAPAGTPGAAATNTGTLGTPPVEKPAADPAPKPEVKPETKPEVKPETKPAKEPVKTAADGGGAPAEEPKTVPLSWEEQAREVAGSDNKLYERLVRQKGVKGVVDAWRAMEVELSSGKYAKKLPTHYTAEELADYKKANNIPDKADGYDINVGEGIVWGETDKPHIDNFTNFALENNMTPQQVKDGLRWWAQYQENLVAQQDEVDQINATNGHNELKGLWGPQFQRNRNFMKGQFDSDKGTYEKFMNARGPDGVRFGDDPQMQQFMFSKFYEANPRDVDLPGNGAAAADPSEEMEKMKPLIANKQSAYWKGDKAPAMQARYRELIEWRERAKARAGG